jgi:hypothetical protein
MAFSIELRFVQNSHVGAGRVEMESSPYYGLRKSQNAVFKGRLKSTVHAREPLW